MFRGDKGLDLGTEKGKNMTSLGSKRQNCAPLSEPLPHIAVVGSAPNARRRVSSEQHLAPFSPHQPKSSLYCPKDG